MLGIPSKISIAISPNDATRAEANSLRYTPPATPIGPVTRSASADIWSEPMMAFKIPGCASRGLLKKNSGLSHGRARSVTNMTRAKSGSTARNAATSTTRRMIQSVRARRKSLAPGASSAS